MDSLISVIIPCFQQGHFLPDAVSSLQRQTYTNWEAIIVNDGSIDKTDYVARALCSADSRIRYIAKPNGGLSSARNTGLDLAQGDWLQFLDADDLLLPQKFEKQIIAAKRSGEGTLTYCSYFLGACDEPARRIEPWAPSLGLCMARPLLDMALRWETELSIPIHSPLFPAYLFREKMIRFDEALSNHEDWDVWMQILELVDNMIFVPEELAIYRVCPNSMCTDRSGMWRGFSTAIKKQRHHFRNDKGILRALNYQMAMNNYSHRRGMRGRLRLLGDDGMLPEWMWPLKCIIRRFVVPPRRPIYS